MYRSGRLGAAALSCVPGAGWQLLPIALSLDCFVASLEGASTSAPAFVMQCSVQISVLSASSTCRSFRNL